MNQSPTPRPSSLKKLTAPLIVLVIASGIYLGLINTTAELDTTVKEPVPVAVRAMIVEPETVNLRVYSEGNVQPRSQTKLLAQVAGEVVYVADTLLSGGQFQLGDTLLKLDPRDYEIARDRAQASVSRSKAELKFARHEAGRVRALYGDEDRKSVV